jgi:hypothetical protein
VGTAVDIVDIVDIGELVARFGVGTPTAPPRPLGGDSSARASAVDTARGRWVVKTAAPLGATVGAYLEAGGPPGPADPTAFAGALRSMLVWAAYSLWLALGHRDATPQRRARAAGHVAAAAEALPAFLASLDGWARLLRA